MAHYAFLDKNNTVVEVIVGKDENEGIHDWEFYYGSKRGMKCVRTSYNTIGGVHSEGGNPFRKNFAGIGYVYDEQRDAFVPPQPYSSWILNEETCIWESPVSRPEDLDNIYLWDEEILNWVVG
jgi:hypothetical protein